MVWRAWNELGSERPHTVTGYAAPMGAMMITSRPMPLPWSAVVAWCDRNGVNDDERMEFVQPLLAVLDHEYIADWQRQQTKQQVEPIGDKLNRWGRDEAE